MPEPPWILPQRLYRQDWRPERQDGPHDVWIHREESLATAYMMTDFTTCPESPIARRVIIPTNHPLSLAGAVRCLEDDVEREPFTGASNA